MSIPEDPEQALLDAITDLRARRAVLGDALVDGRPCSNAWPR